MAKHEIKKEKYEEGDTVVVIKQKNGRKSAQFGNEARVTESDWGNEGKVSSAKKACDLYKLVMSGLRYCTRIRPRARADVGYRTGGGRRRRRFDTSVARLELPSTPSAEGLNIQQWPEPKGRSG